MSVAARTHWPVSEAKMPTGVTQPIDKFFANPAAVQLAPLELDDVFSDLVRDASGQATMSLRGKAQQLDVVLGANYRAVVIYAPKPAPGQDPAARNFVCIEPVAGNHQRAESCPQGCVQRAAEHPSGWCLAGAFLDSSQRVLTMSRTIAFVLSLGLLVGISHAQVRRGSHLRRHRASEAGRMAELQRSPQRKSPQPAGSHQHAQRRNARAEVDARDGRQARASDDAARRRRRHVRGSGERGARVGRANRQADLAVRPSADAGTRSNRRPGVRHQPRNRRARQSRVSSDRSRASACPRSTDGTASLGRRDGGLS